MSQRLSTTRKEMAVGVQFDIIEEMVRIMGAER